MNELIYWKLKAKLAEIEIQEVQIINNLNNIRINKRKLLADHGLDTNKQYSFNDTNCEFEEIKPNGK